MLTQKKFRYQQGIATIELVPVLLAFVVLFNFTLGFFGVIHSGILNSIAARNYAFETFRNRSNLNRFRDDTQNAFSDIAHNKDGFRYHSIISEGAPAVSSGEPTWYVTSRAIKFTDQNQGIADDSESQDHSRVRQIRDPGKAKDVYDQAEGIRSVWVKTAYGICLNHSCQPPP